MKRLMNVWVFIHAVFLVMMLTPLCNMYEKDLMAVVFLDFIGLFVIGTRVNYMNYEHYKSKYKWHEHP